MNTVSYLGFKILNTDYLVARKKIKSGSVLTISPNSYGITTKNQDLKSALSNCNILVLDGIYFALGYLLKTGKTIKKNQGPEIFYKELKLQAYRNGRVFFLGTSKENLTNIRNKMSQIYPTISVQTFSPPYCEKLSDNDNQIIHKKITSFNPDVVFVGMTCPKQEIWINEQIARYPNILFLGVGGVLDWFSGQYKELNPLWWKLGLGWLGRIIQRPEILKRNLPNIFIYLRDMFK